MTYSVELLTLGCVHETSMRAYTSTSLRIMTITSGSVEYNELNRRLSLAIVGNTLNAMLSVELLCELWDFSLSPVCENNWV